jgi:predicted hydrocarbon binding protein
MTIAQKALRNELGDMMSSVCFKSAVTGLEEALGEKAAAISLIAAGRKRGKQLAEHLGLVNKSSEFPLSDITSKLQHALGKDGTRLCVIDRIEQFDDRWKVYTRETVCSAGELEGSSRQCTYTLGAIQGFLEAFSGKRLRGKHTDSVLRGSDHDVLEYEVLI